MLLYLLGISCRGVEDFLTALGCPLDHVTVYRDVQEAGEKGREVREEWLKQAGRVKVVRYESVVRFPRSCRYWAGSDSPHLSPEKKHLQEVWGLREVATHEPRREFVSLVAHPTHLLRERVCTAPCSVGE